MSNYTFKDASGLTQTAAAASVASALYPQVQIVDNSQNVLAMTTSGALQVNSADSSTTGTITAADAIVGAPGGAGATVSGASTAGSLVSLQCPGGDSSWIMQLSGTLGSSTFYFEGSIDSTNGTTGNWININGRQTGIVNTVLAGSTTTASIFRGNTSGWTWIRLRAVGGAAISAAVKIEISSGTGAIFLNASIPAGSNTIGNIGSIVGTYSEDAPHTTADKGLFVLGVRNDTVSSITSTDGDYSPMATGPAGEMIVANSPITKWFSTQTSVMYGTSVQALAPQGASIFTYITGVQIANNSSIFSLVKFTGGLGSVLAWTVAPPNGGSNINFINPLRTGENSGFSASISGVSSIYLSAQGFTAKT